MSRIGKLPISLPKEVNYSAEANRIKLTGPKGTLEISVPAGIEVKTADNQLLVEADLKDEQLRPLYGTFRAILANGVAGVGGGWTKQLELVGTGYRSEVKGKNLLLTVGYSHPIEVEAPQGVNFKVEKNIITVEGVDKNLVGQVAAKIRQIRPPEPYKGKGIHYLGEIIRRKAGKAAKTAGAAA